MLFSNLTFLYLFIPVLLIFYFIIDNIKWRNGVLILFSLLFYAWGGPKFLIIMLGTVAINYMAGLIIAQFNENEKSKLKKFTLFLTVVLNLSILFAFKYSAFFADCLNLIPFVSLPLPEVVLPLGISFFTFQAMSYTIDVYRGDVAVQKSPLRLLLYISLFPQLIAGPIVRYGDVCEQIEYRRITLTKINDGLFRFSVGLGKKVLLANSLGDVADTLLGASVEKATVLSGWLGALFYALQIYYDFSGYSDMAIGLGKILGFDFSENFDYPYISGSATEFWRRWHISLGSFFRDYLYIPLGGNRHFWLRNVLIVWLLTGLWHGASVNFILWGLFYGILLVFEKKLFLPLLSKIGSGWRKVISFFYMTFVTLFGWTLFYYTDGLADRIKILFGIGTPLGDIYELSVLRSNIWLLLVGLLFITPAVPALFGSVFHSVQQKNRYAVVRYSKTVFIIISLAVSTVLLCGSSYNPFLYFRF